MKKGWIGVICAVMAVSPGLAACSTGQTAYEAETVEEEADVAAEPGSEIGETTYVYSSSEEETPAEDQAGSEDTVEIVQETESPVSDDDVVTFVTDDSLADVSDATDIQGGTNMNDAVLLPLETRLLGTIHNGEAMWFAFTTTSDVNAVYRFTAVNKTVNTPDVRLGVYDVEGNELAYWYAGEWGGFETKNVSLDPDTTYYLQVGEKYDDTYTMDFMLIIREENKAMTAYQTADNIFVAKGASFAENEEIYATQNVDDAIFLPLNSKITGKVHDGMNFFFAFETSGVENADYSLSAVNMNVGTGDLGIYLYDEYGEKITEWYASQDGQTATKTVRLDPNSPYYVGLCERYHNDDIINYTLEINGPEDEATEELVFETPFELNETQVMFVAESDKFIDKDAAIAAVEPIAEAVLAHPDHSILIAGTTATDGSQADRVTLSNRRAAAVKDLLVNEFGVPASQIETVGLGYEKDPFERGQDREVAGDINSNFIESEGKKNRRVVIMDIDDPIAQEILSSS